jgi:hypothetical protein
LGPVAIVGSKWGISTAGDVRTGAKVLLHSNGNPVVIAKEIEKGRVIWSGINSMMRIEGGKNENTNEIEFLKKSISWLLKTEPQPQDPTPDSLIVKTKRLTPDKLQFTLLENTSAFTTLYFRESYYPKWQATLKNGHTQQTLRVEKAGPRFIGIRVPPVTEGATISLEFKKSLLDYGLEVVGVATVLIIVLYLCGVITGTLNKIKELMYRSRHKLQTAKESAPVFKVHEDPNEEV